MKSHLAIKIPVYLATIAAILLITYFSLPKKNNFPETPLRLMTFNIRLDIPIDGDNSWSNRKKMVAGLIDDFRCDFIGLQEVLPHQMSEISEFVPRYKAIFRTREINPEEGEGSPVLYDDNSWMLMNSGTFWLSATPYEPGSNTWGAACNRIATWGRFRHKETRRTVFVINTHFDHVSQVARENSINLILEKIFILSEGSPVVFMGDLNVEENNSVYERITENENLTDAYRSIHPEPKPLDLTFNGWQPGEGISRIDYIFTSKEFRIHNARVIKNMMNNRYPSDHFPVFIEATY